MRKGKKHFDMYLDEKEDAALIDLLKREGTTKTIKDALRLYEMGLRIFPDIQSEEECIEGVPLVGGYQDEA